MVNELLRKTTVDTDGSCPLVCRNLSDTGLVRAGLGSPDDVEEEVDSDEGREGRGRGPCRGFRKSDWGPKVLWGEVVLHRSDPRYG